MVSSPSIHDGRLCIAFRSFSGETFALTDVLSNPKFAPPAGVKGPDCLLLFANYRLLYKRHAFSAQQTVRQESLTHKLDGGVRLIVEQNFCLVIKWGCEAEYAASCERVEERVANSRRLRDQFLNQRGWFLSGIAVGDALVLEYIGFAKVTQL